MRKITALLMMLTAVSCGGRQVGQTVTQCPTASPPTAPSAAAAVPSETAPAPPTAHAGFVVNANVAPTLAAGHGKAWITKLATGKNAFVGLIKMAPKAAIPEHRDTTEEYVYVLSGGGQLTMGGKTHTIGPQSFIFMPADVTISYQNGDAELVALQVFAGPGPAGKYDDWKAVEP